MKEYFERALKNIAKFGDTDIFPFPFERYLFAELEDKVIEYLEKIHQNFDEIINQSPPLTLVQLSPVGYYGFRQATMIEPFWNAYFLALVISLAEEIEKRRVSDELVFSYRYEWNDEKSSLFRNSTWNHYKKQCINHAKKCEYVLQTDISNFYPRINHHKLENHLKKLNDPNENKKKILSILKSLSGTISYGLPVGGPASRILAELSLHHVDSHLKSHNITFCRYADDYTIFCNSESDAYKALIFLSEKLSIDQLSLQKNKTTVMSSSEYLEINNLLEPESDSSEVDEEQKLLNISIQYDPYSETAEEDYETLKESLNEIDIIGILAREVNKTKIDQAVSKQTINAIKYLSTQEKSSAVSLLFDQKNMETLSPIFSTIMRLTRAIYADISMADKEKIDVRLISLIKEKHYLSEIDINLSFIVQILSATYSDEKEILLTELFGRTRNSFLKRQIIVAMANWERDHFLVDVKNQFNTLSEWERRAVIYSSYFLDDEGGHWRNHNKKGFSPEENILRDWFALRKQKDQQVNV